jgi:hypothetical protein
VRELRVPPVRFVVGGILASDLEQQSRAIPIEIAAADDGDQPLNIRL